MITLCRVGFGCQPEVYEGREAELDEVCVCERERERERMIV